MITSELLIAFGIGAGFVAVWVAAVLLKEHITTLYAHAHGCLCERIRGVWFVRQDCPYHKRKKR